MNTRQLLRRLQAEIDVAIRAAQSDAEELQRFQTLAIELGAFVEVRKDKSRRSLLLRLEIDAGLIAAAADQEMLLQSILANEVYPQLLAEVQK